MSDTGINKSIHAVIQWSWDDETCSLIDPDPDFGHIYFTTRFDATHSYFELRIDAKIKRTRLKHAKHTDEGDDDLSAFHLRVNASAVKTLTFESNTTADSDIHKKHSSRAPRDQITRVRIQTERNFEVLVPVNAEEPLTPCRRLSGEILDKIKQISNTTDLYIYVRDSDLSAKDLQSISSAYSQCLDQEDDKKHDLKSLYGGKGAKVVDLSPQTEQLPPSYDEVTSTPPAPVVPVNPLKRRRQKGDDDPMAVLTKREKQIFDMMENKILANIEEQVFHVHGLEKRVKELEAQNQYLGETIVELTARIENQR